MPPFDLELKQSIKGVWHVNSLKINAENIDELDNKIDSTISYLHQKLNKINRGETFPQPPTLKEEAKEIILTDEEKELFNKLRNTRTTLSQEQGIPPYYVFQDKTLKHFAKNKPMTKEEMLRIPGIAEKKFESYGVHFLKTIRSSCLKN